MGVLGIPPGEARAEIGGAEHGVAAVALEPHCRLAVELAGPPAAVRAADKGDAGIKIASSKLEVTAYGLKGLDAAGFTEVAKEAEGRCPVSNAYRGTMEITVDAKVA